MSYLVFGLLYKSSDVIMTWNKDVLWGWIIHNLHRTIHPYCSRKEASLPVVYKLERRLRECFCIAKLFYFDLLKKSYDWVSLNTLWLASSLHQSTKPPSFRKKIDACFVMSNAKVKIYQVTKFSIISFWIMVFWEISDV